MLSIFIALKEVIIKPTLRLSAQITSQKDLTNKKYLDKNVITA